MSGLAIMARFIGFKLDSSIGLFSIHWRLTRYCNVTAKGRMQSRRIMFVSRKASRVRNEERRRCCYAANCA